MTSWIRAKKRIDASPSETFNYNVGCPWVFFEVKAKNDHMASEINDSENELLVVDQTRTETFGLSCRTVEVGWLK